MKRILAHIAAFIVWFVTGVLILAHPISSTIKKFNSLDSIPIEVGFVGILFLVICCLGVGIHALVENLFD